MVIKTFIRSLLLLLFFSIGGKLYAQQISVDQLSGAARVNIPIYTLNRGRINVPISISHYGNGIKAKDVEGSAGMGWYLSAGGSISREVRDLPDDLTTSNKGWLYNSNGTAISNFSIANDNNSATCSDETTDLNYMSNNIANLSDTEADVFHINVPGISCKLVFDANKAPRTIPYQDIKISYTLGSAGIASFRLINDQGIIYDFELAEIAFKKTVSSNPSSILFYKDLYNKYQTEIAYNRKWLLTKISEGDNQVYFRYNNSDEKEKRSVSPYEFYIGNTTTKTLQFKVEERAPTYTLIGITYDVDGDVSLANKVGFTYSYISSTNMPIVTRIDVPGKSYTLSYKNAFASSNQGYYRSFLSEITLAGSSDTPVRLKFDYNGVTPYGNTWQTSLPDSSSKQLDRWGYYDANVTNSLLPEVYINTITAGIDRFRYTYKSSMAGSYPYYISGRSRDVNPLSVTTGTLKKVTDLNGKETVFSYEPNSYYDPQAVENVYGAGVRVKKVVEYDVADTTVKKTINYTYLDPVTGYSSGKPLSLPVYAFVRPYTGAGSLQDQWQASVVRSEENLSTEDNSILYTHVRETIAGMGYKNYSFVVPASHFESSASPDWAPTIVNIAGCAGAGYLVNDKNTYPFVNHPNFDFERGLPLQLSSYNQAGQKVSETNYTHTRVGTPTYIYSLRKELNNGITTYAKYYTITGINKEVQTQTEILYDLANSTQQQSVVNYAFESSNHQYPTTIWKTNSNGSTTISRTKYSKDYDLSIAVDSAAVTLKRMVIANMNVPVEKYTQIQWSGVTKTVAAELMKFATFYPPYSAVRYMPVKSMSFMDGNGVSDFQVSSIQSGNFNNDSRYFPVSEMLAYNKVGQLLSSKPANGQTSSSLYNDVTGLPKASFVNAAYNEVVHEDFEPNYDYSLLVEGTAIPTNDAHTGNLSVAFSSGIESSYPLRKKQGANYYLFSIWIKTANAGNLQIRTVGNASNTYNMAYSNTNDKWVYRTLKIPVAALTGTFDLKLQSSTSLLVDDILFYPTDANVSTQTVQPNTLFKTSETTGNGQTVYYDYDVFGRLKHVYDKDKNMIQKKTYISKESIAQYGVAVGHSGNSTILSPQYFSDATTNTTTDGLNYVWNFGDGTPSVNASGGFVPHTYTTAGTYTVTVSKSSPYYGAASTSYSITIGNPTNISVHSSGDISLLTFSQGSTIVYQFSQSQLSSGTVTINPGVYTVRVSAPGAYSTTYPQSPNGFKSLGYVGYGPNGTGEYKSCYNSTPHVVLYDFTIDFTGKQTISFFTDNQVCPFVEVGEVQ